MAWRKDDATGAWKRYRRTFDRLTRTWEYKEVKSRKKLTTEDSITVNVRCSGHIHSISYTPHPEGPPGRKPVYGGRLSLHHHDKEDYILEKAMSRLGTGRVCRCFTVWNSFLDVVAKSGTYGYTDKSLLPAELRHVLIDVLAPQERRKHSITWNMERRVRATHLQKYTKHYGGDELAVPMAERRALIIELAVLRTLRKSRYFSMVKRDPKHDEYHASTFSGADHNSNHIHGQVGGAQHTWHGGIQLTATVEASRWWKLYRLGFALVEGIFIADVANEISQRTHPVGEHEVLVWAGKPSTGFKGATNEYESIETTLAVIAFDGETWTIKGWL